MKTTKLIFALSLALILNAGYNNMYAQQKSNNDVPEEVKARKVAYVVRIENIGKSVNLQTHYLVMMTDETGRRIAPAQTYRPGVWDYTFFENGSVRGTRVARMVQMPHVPNSPEFIPDSKTGIFYGGACYLFTIKPVFTTGDSGTDKN
jgi:hypothetical protein